MNPALAIAMKDLRLIARDRLGAFFTLIFPIFIAILFGYLFGGGGDERGKLRVAVALIDASPEAAAFARDLEADSAFEVSRAATEREGADLVRRGKADACVVLADGFGASMRSMFAGRAAAVEVLLPPGRQAEGGLLTGKLTELAFRQAMRTFADPASLSRTLDDARGRVAESPGFSPAQKALFGSMFDSVAGLSRGLAPAASETPAGDAGGFAWRPVEVTLREVTKNSSGPRSSFEISFPQGVVWALMGCVMAFAAGMSEERTRGTLLRLSAAPLSRAHVLAGKALACFALCMFVQTILLGLAVGVFAVRPQPLMMVACMICSSLAVVGVVVLIAGVARTEAAAQGGARAVVITLAIIGGGSVPLFVMPAIMQKVSGVSPFRWMVLGMEGSMWRRFTWGEFAFPAGVLVAIALGGFALGVLALRRAPRA